MHGVVFVLRNRSSNKRNGGSLSFFTNLRPKKQSKLLEEHHSTVIIPMPMNEASLLMAILWEIRKIKVN